MLVSMPAFRKVKKGGRPPKLNDELIEKICNTLRLGTYIETAVVLAGVQKVIFYEWIKLAHKNPGSIHAKLLNAVEKAQEESVVRDLLNIDKCAMGQDWEYERDPQGNLVLNGKGNPIPKKQGIPPDWHASAWRLERRHPKQWSRTEKLETTGKDGGPQVIVTIPSNGRDNKPDGSTD